MKILRAIIVVILSIFVLFININNAEPEKNTVIIKNALQNNKNLKAHCKSGDDDLKLRTLSPRSSFDFSFQDNYLGTTLFWCHMWQGPGYKHHQAFVVYDSVWHYYNAVYHWEARENGIYLCVDDEKPCKLKYHWDVPHKASSTDLAFGDHHDHANLLSDPNNSF